MSCPSRQKRCLGHGQPSHGRPKRCPRSGARIKFPGRDFAHARRSVMKWSVSRQPAAPRPTASFSFHGRLALQFVAAAPSGPALVRLADDGPAPRPASTNPGRARSSWDQSSTKTAGHRLPAYQGEGAGGAETLRPGRRRGGCNDNVGALC